MIGKTWSTAIFAGFLMIVAGAGSTWFTGCGERASQNVSPEKEVPADSRTMLPLDQVPEEERELLEMARRYFQPLPEKAENPDNPLNETKILLGKMLYHDPRLSLSGLISCNTCHNLALGGVDGLPTSIGHRWQKGPRNAPTVYNAALHFAQFWDGRAKDVEEQAEKPILNPVEMAAPSEEFVVERIRSIPEYVELFQQAFPGEADPVTYRNIARAIAAFERTLIFESRFDRYLRGQTDALTPTEKEGLRTFIEVGCITCHTGPLLGGNMYQKFGLYGNYWEYTRSERIDSGRYTQTGNPADLFLFKVPSLRDVTRTAPYFHDGSVWSLDSAIWIMGKLQLNRDLTPEEVQAIRAFFQSLESEVSEGALQVPMLPPSTEKTARPVL